MAGDWKRVGSRWVSPTGASISNYQYLKQRGHSPSLYGQRGRLRAEKQGIVPKVRYRPTPGAPAPRQPEPIRPTADPFAYRTNKAGLRMAVASQPITLERLRLLVERMPGRYYSVAVKGRHRMEGVSTGRARGKSPMPGLDSGGPTTVRSPDRFFAARLTRHEVFRNGGYGPDDVRETILGWEVDSPSELQIVAHP